MTESRYWTADNPYGYSVEDLQHLDRDELIDVMKTWFFQKFEDPAESTPYESAEGGYQWIWGGPYDATEELASEFGEHVPEQVIKEVVGEIEADGLFDWAPKRSGDDYDVAVPDEPSWPPLDVLQTPNRPKDEDAARREVLDRLAALEEAVRGLGDQPSMMGHNRPPEPLEDLPFSADDSRAINLVIQVVRGEAEVPRPDVSRLEQEASNLRDIASRLGQWLKQRLAKGADAFVAVIGAGLAAKLTGLYDALVGGWQAIVNWIQLIISAH